MNKILEDKLNKLNFNFKNTINRNKINYLYIQIWGKIIMKKDKVKKIKVKKIKVKKINFSNLFFIIFSSFYLAA